VLTEHGKHHPITDVHTWSSSSEALWQTLPVWHGYNHTGSASPHSVVLASDAKGMPLVAVRETGAGRTMSVATDSLWRWRFTPHNTQHTVYHSFIAKALRWLVRDPAHSRLRVTPHKRAFEHNASVGVSVRLVDEQYNPLPQAVVSLTLLDAQKKVLHKDTLTTQTQGQAERMYGPLAPGAYTVQATYAESHMQHEGTSTFVVTSHTLESVQPAPRPDVMAFLAQNTQAQHSVLDEKAWEKLTFLPTQTTDVERKKNTDVWDNGMALCAVLACMACEWFLRRRSGWV
jgi:hypothetical protein